MDFDQYQTETARTFGDHNNEYSAFASYGMGVSGEAGEVCDYLKKVIFHGHQLDEVKLSKELGDVLWYVSAIATTAGLSLRDIAEKNIDKLRQRYPEGFDSNRSQNRSEDDI